MENKEKIQNKIIEVMMYVLFIYSVLSLIFKRLLILIDRFPADSIKYYYIILIPLLLLNIYLIISFQKNKIKKRFLILFLIISIFIPVGKMEFRSYGPSSTAKMHGGLTISTDDIVLKYESKKWINMYGIKLKEDEWKRGENK